MEKKGKKRKKSSKKKYKNDYVSKAHEWQEHQYSPGHYVGKPPYVGKKRVTGKIYLGLGIFLIILATATIIRFFDRKQLIPMIIYFLLVSAWGGLMIAAGIRLMKKDN